MSSSPVSKFIKTIVVSNLYSSLDSCTNVFYTFKCTLHSFSFIDSLDFHDTSTFPIFFNIFNMSTGSICTIDPIFFFYFF